MKYNILVFITIIILFILFIPNALSHNEDFLLTYILNLNKKIIQLEYKIKNQQPSQQLLLEINKLKQVNQKLLINIKKMEKKIAKLEKIHLYQYWFTKIQYFENIDTEQKDINNILFKYFLEIENKLGDVLLKDKKKLMQLLLRKAKIFAVNSKSYILESNIKIVGMDKILLQKLQLLKKGNQNQQEINKLFYSWLSAIDNEINSAIDNEINPKKQHSIFPVIIYHKKNLQKTNFNQWINKSIKKITDQFNRQQKINYYIIKQIQEIKRELGKSMNSVLQNKIEKIKNMLNVLKH